MVRATVMVCEHLRRAASLALSGQDPQDVRLVTFPARCGRPPLGDNDLPPAADGADRVLVMGGACAAQLSEAPPPGVHVCCLCNCAYALAPEAQVDDLVARGAYLVTPGWLDEWPRHLADMGLDQTTAVALFGETAKRVVLLDSGEDSDAMAKLEGFAGHIGLPSERLPVGLSLLRLLIEDALRQILVERLSTRLSDAQAEMADQAMATELSARVASTGTEEEAAAVILDLADVLFAPATTAFLSFDVSREVEAFGSAEPAQRARLRLWAECADEIAGVDGAWNELMARFVVGGQLLGALGVWGVAFPQWLDRYRKLAANMAPPLAMCLGNVRRVSAESEAREERVRQRVQRLRSLGVVAGGVAHHLNNTLMAIQGYASLALEGNSGIGIPRTLAAIVDQTERATQLGRRMLQFLGGNIRDADRVDMALVAGRVHEAPGSAVPDGCSLDLDCGRRPLRVVGDEELLTQALRSLVTNALEAMAGRTGTVAIQLRRRRMTAEGLAGTYVDDGLPPGPHIALSVRDDGCGVNAATLSSMFDPFFSTKMLGRGLELAATLGIVRAHRGAVSVQSIVDRGTTVTLFLPEDTED